MDALRKLGLIGLGLVDMTEAKAKELASQLIERGEARAESVEGLARALQEKAGEVRAGFDARVEKAVATALSKAGLARAKDLDALVARVESLEKKPG